MVAQLAHSKSKSPSLVHPPQDAPHPGEAIYVQGSLGACKLPTEPHQVLPVPPSSGTPPWALGSLQSSPGQGRCLAVLHINTPVSIALKEASR